MRWLVLLVACGCTGYQAEPYLEVQTRDEAFNLPAETYTGETLTVGVRYVPPVILDTFQLTRLESAIRGNPVPITINQAQDQSVATEAVEAVKDIDWTWPMVAALLVIAWIIREARQWRKNGTTPSDTSVHA